MPCLILTGLVDPISVAMGIGPVCAEKWGFIRPDPIQVTKEVVKTEEKPSVKYDYPAGMSSADKQKFRAAARRAAKETLK